MARCTTLLGDSWTTAAEIDPRINLLGDGIMLDVLLDCFGVVALFGQAALFLVFGQIEASTQ